MALLQSLGWFPRRSQGVALGCVIPRPTGVKGREEPVDTVGFGRAPCLPRKLGVQAFRVLAIVPQVRHDSGMTATVKLDASNRVVLSRDLRRAAGIPRGQRLKVSATPGRLVLEVQPNPGRVVKRGKLKLWSGQVPATPIEEAVEVVRHYER